jgi:hypothetical protein
MSTALLELPPNPSTSARAGHEKPVDFNHAEFSAKFSRVPFLITHELCDHPLFDLHRLMELAQQLPEKLIEYNAGELDVNQDPTRTPRNGLSVEETINRIQTCKSWMVLKHVQNDPAYGELLEQCLSVVRPHSEPIAPGMRHPQAFIFLTSPGSVTPYHMDPEHNFLLQVRGSKTIHLFDGRDPSIVSPEDLEKFYGANTRHMTLAPENKDRAWVFDLQPGFGLHFPVCYPHYVSNGSEVSISFSITFRTPDLERRRAVHAANHRVRQAGGRPPLYGERPWRDAWVFQSYRLRRKLAALTGKK